MRGDPDHLLGLLEDVRKKSKRSPSTLRLLAALTDRVVELTAAYNTHQHHGHSEAGDGEYTSRGDVTVGTPVRNGAYGCHAPHEVPTAPPGSANSDA